MLPGAQQVQKLWLHSTGPVTWVLLMMKPVS
jgi:hypothetical protein